ncbi:MAG: carotenoid biosynthesis protein [Cyanobacteria bacterium J06642_2]
MNRWNFIERSALTLHLSSLVFGLAGLLLVVPHPEWILSLPEFGQRAFDLSMGNGSIVYMVSGAIAALFVGQRLIGWWRTLLFFVVAVGISLGGELAGTSMGIPFGEYSYLNGLGYKINGLVPFTIPLSWFYVGFSSFLLALTVLRQSRHWLMVMEAIALGALILTSWDFVLDPAMTQTLMPFWEWLQPGPFFGMPLQNFGGWMLTGALFMTVATLLWRPKSLPILSREQLNVPLVIYIANFTFATIMSLGHGIVTPVFLGLLLGLIPALSMWFLADEESELEVGDRVAFARLSPVIEPPLKPSVK